MQFQIPSDTNLIGATVDRIVEGIRESCDVSGNCEDLAVALFEALANAMIHGNQQQADKPVHISWEYEPNKHIVIIIRDEGAGFDPDAVPDPTSPENLAADHGRGILMMKTFMDEVHFEKGGTEVHLLKRCV